MAQTTPTYYYVDGKRQELVRQDGLIAVKLLGADSKRSATTRSARGPLSRTSSHQPMPISGPAAR